MARPSDAAAMIEMYYEKGWTDGLPVVPPSEASVGAMLAAAGPPSAGKLPVPRRPPVSWKERGRASICDREAKTIRNRMIQPSAPSIPARRCDP